MNKAIDSAQLLCSISATMTRLLVKQARLKLRSRLADRGMDYSDLAKILGYARASIANQASQGNTSITLRDRIEEFLGEPIWSNGIEFAARKNHRRSSLSISCESCCGPALQQRVDNKAVEPGRSFKSET